MKNPFADKMITRLLEQYEIDVEMTFVDLVDRIEELAEDTGDINLSLAVKKYREEERYDLEYLGMRGDMDAVETSFLESIRRQATGISNSDINGSASPKVWDYTMVKNAIENNEPYPAVFIEKVIGVREHELPLLEKTGYRLKGDTYVSPSGKH
jgi:hypothetical protein